MPAHSPATGWRLTFRNMLTKSCDMSCLTQWVEASSTSRKRMMLIADVISSCSGKILSEDQTSAMSLHLRSLNLSLWVCQFVKFMADDPMGTEDSDEADKLWQGRAQILLLHSGPEHPLTSSWKEFTDSPSMSLSSNDTIRLFI